MACDLGADQKDRGLWGRAWPQGLRFISLGHAQKRRAGVDYDVSVKFDRGQTREICEKQEKYFKGKVVTFTVQSLILYQYPVDLLTVLEHY